MNPPNRNKPGDPLTEKQRDIFVWFVGETVNNMRQPTVREIMSHFGFQGPNGANRHIRALVEKGYLGYDPDSKSRSLRILRREGITEARYVPPPFEVHSVVEVA